MTRLAMGLSAGGGICLVVGMLFALLVADHSSSDSSPSSLIAIVLGSLGFLSALLGALLFAGIALGRLWRWGRRRRPETSG